MKKLASAILATFLFSSFALTAFAADTANPSDVENLKATAMDGAVELTWNKATDDTGVTGYKVFYGLTAVNKKGQKYDSQKDVKDVLKYTVTNLANGKKYYFSVVAYDAASNESLNWATGLKGANEISATPAKGAADDKAGPKDEDKDAPQVADSEALNNVEVKVVFSEKIVLPKDNPEDAFDIEDQDKFGPLLVTAAKMDTEDETNKTVILTTAKQQENVEYKLTVGIDVKDKAGNPMVSGTSDTAVFQGSGEEKPSADVVGPSVVKIESVDNTHVLVNFDETIVLSIDPAEDFEITVESDKTKKLSVLGVKLGTNSASVEDSSAIV
ncbi:MAG: fibronectin type III domain-containing protein, partial [Patescibacteria group bacterium]